MRAILIGAGIGGLTAALALSRRGANVTLIDRAPVLGEIGAGLQLGPNATRILFSLGLEAEVTSAGFRPAAAEVRLARDQTRLLRTELGSSAEARWGAPYLQLHRADLQGLLLRSVQALPNVSVRLGMDVLRIENRPHGAVAILQDGERLEGDVIVGCDGVRSFVREQMFGPDAPRFTGQVAWRGVVPADALPKGLIAPVAAVWNGPGHHFVHYYVRGGEFVNFVGVVERDWRLESWTEPGDPAELQVDFQGWPEPVQALCQAVKTPFRWALFGRKPLARWSIGCITLLGDACHPMLPFLAQGAAMAIEDAEVLAQQLMQPVPPELALKSYEGLRMERTSRVQRASAFNARVFHLPETAARAAFMAASAMDQFNGRGGAAARFDWIYGYRAP